GETGGDDDGGTLVELGDQVEQELTAGLGEGQVAEFVEDYEVAGNQLVGDAPRPPGAGLGLELVDEVDDVEEAAAPAAADAGPGDRHAQMGLAGAGPADQHDAALPIDDGTTGERSNQGLVDRGAAEVELGELLGQRQPGGGELVLDGARLLLGDLGLEQVADDILDGMLALEPGGQHLVEGGPHAG